MSSTEASGDGRGRAGKPARGRRGVTMRAVVLGLVLTPVNVFFLVSTIWGTGTFAGRHSLFINTVAVLFAMALLNMWLRKRGSAWAFSAGEMLTVYSMLGIGTGLVASPWDVGGELAGIITYPFWFATEQNGWRELLWPNLPTWLTVRDQGVLEGFYTGQSSAYNWMVLRAWAVPAMWWAVLVGGMMWTCLCLNSIVRRRWADEEKLPFPMAVLPVDLADEGSALLRNRLFWIGVGVSSAVLVWNTLARVMPTLPAVPLEAGFWTTVAGKRPWNFIRIPALQWDPWTIGLCYLMPQDMALSVLVFDLLWQTEFVVAGQMGWCVSQWSGFPYGDEQALGAWMALLGAVVWLDRRYLAAMVRAAIGGRSSVGRGEEGEAFSPRGALVGLGAGSVLLWWVLWRAGMPHWAVPAFLGVYYGMSMMISRVRAQIGPPAHQFWKAMPSESLPIFMGYRALGRRALGFMSLMKAFMGEQHNNPTPIQLEALKMAEGGRMERRRIALVLAVVAPVAILCYFWASIHYGYQIGLGTPKAQVDQLNLAMWNTTELDAHIRHPGDLSKAPMIAVGVGAVVTVLLAWMKLNFLWWPLHPVAFPLALSATLQYLPAVIFSTWLLKALLLRYGGLQAHRRALPFFLGLLVGGATAEVLQQIFLDLIGVRI